MDKGATKQESGRPELYLVPITMSFRWHGGAPDPTVTIVQS